jgi:pyruvate-formate lyase-activating enzyme
MPFRYLAWRRGAANPRIPPNRVYVETTNRCNLKCPQCPTGLEITGRPGGDLEEGLFRTIANEMGPLAETAILHIWGEPLLNPRLEGMVTYAAARGLRTEISTNAMLLDASRTQTLLKSGLSRIYLCIDGLDEETYSRIRVGGNFEKVRRNIEGFIQKNLEAGAPVDVRVQLIDTDLTRNQIQAFRRAWSRYEGVGVNIKAFDSWGGKVERINALNRKGRTLPPPPHRYPCPNLWYHAHIFYDGTLVCCDRDFDLAHPLGNVEGGVMRVWRGETMRALRTAHGEGRIETEPCRSCKEWAWWKPGLFSSWGNAPQDSADQR